MIHGSSPGPAIFMRNPDPANWGKWSLIPNPELWQAVCLSMDFEPPKSCDVVEFLRLDQKTFKDRMQVCMANIGPHPELEVARVNLATFAAVVSKWGWPIPQQLQALEQHAPTPATATPTKPNESIADRDARWLALLEQEERSNPKGAQAKTCRLVCNQEGVPPDTVKAALQKAKRKRAERYRQGGAVTLSKQKGKDKNPAHAPFGTGKGKR
jgi:hypothetical protein